MSRKAFVTGVGMTPFTKPGVGPAYDVDEATDALVGMPELPLAIRYFAGAGASHMKKYGTPLEAFAKVRAKASRHAVNDPLAVLKTELSTEEVLKSTALWPGVMTRLMACPPTCGGAAAVLTSGEFAKAAGYTWDSVIQKMTDEQWYAMLDVHLTSPFRILRAAQPVIRALRKAEETEGREVFRKVVNISSIAGLGGNAGQANYSTAKAGVIGLTKALSKEWGRLKVNVNCVAFGLIKTRLTEAPAGTGATITVEGSEIKVGINPDLMVMLEQNIPLGRAGTPDEAAEAVYSLCTPQSNYISGQVVVCGGGISI